MAAAEDDGGISQANLTGLLPTQRRALVQVQREQREEACDPRVCFGDPRWAFKKRKSTRQRAGTHLCGSIEFDVNQAPRGRVDDALHETVVKRVHKCLR